MIKNRINYKKIIAVLFTLLLCVTLALSTFAVGIDTDLAGGDGLTTDTMPSDRNARDGNNAADNGGGGAADNSNGAGNGETGGGGENGTGGSGDQITGDNGSGSGADAGSGSGIENEDDGTFSLWGIILAIVIAVAVIALLVALFSKKGRGGNGSKR